MAVPLLVEAVAQNGFPSSDVQDLLQRIKCGDDPQTNVDVAWQVFRVAEKDHLLSLRVDLQSVPNETRPIIAATVARLEGRNPIDELDHYRTTGRYTLSKAAADALGRYLADPDLSGTETGHKYLVRGVTHDDERVRRATLSELKRRNDPKTVEELISLILAGYPLNSPRRTKRRATFVAIVRTILYLPIFLFPLLAQKLEPGVIVVSVFTGIYLAVILEAWLMRGAKRLAAEAQGEILSCIADIEPDSPTALVDKLPELRAIQSGSNESEGTTRAVRRLIERIEAASSEIRDLPLAASPTATTPTELPLPAENRL